MKSFLSAVGGITFLLFALFNFVMGLKNHDAYCLVLSIIDIRIADAFAERMD